MTKHAVQNCYRVLNMPYITLEVTSKCNSQCKTCNIWRMQTDARKKGKSELGRDEWCRIIVQLKELGCKSVELHGGEPTIRRDLPELVKCCSQQGMATTFSTNGLSMTKELASKLVKAGLSQIIFSVDGPKETHNLIRGRNDAFERQMRAIGAFHKADQDNQVAKMFNTTISSMNIRNIEETVDVARQMNISRMRVFLASVVGPEVARQTNEVFNGEVAYHRSLLGHNILIRDISLIKRKRRQLLRRAEEQGVRLNNSTFFTMPVAAVACGIKRNPTPCSHIYSSCVIDSFGEVFPCEYIRYRLGNIREKPLKEILTDGSFKLFSRAYSENFKRLSICMYCCHSL